jgi:branched-chain amino acid transport system substrate-binding protein
MVTGRSKLIVLDVGEGDFDRGFPVVLRISDAGKPHTVEFRGRLPPAPEIPELYARWQTAYYGWGSNHRWWRVLRVDFPPQTTNVSHWDDCTHAAQALQERLRQWFNHPDLRDLREQILIEVRRSDPARLIVQTQNGELRRLPWHFWSLLERLPQLEIGISAQHSAVARRLRHPVKILAVLGNSEGIDIQDDPALLEALPHAKVVRLVEPTRQALSDSLFQQPWDILFFAGHSRSEVNGETGYLWINQDDRLTPRELKFALTHAVQNGLQLAIFNSCDGLGLGRELADLQIPHLVVMREPVPDPIAQAFLKYFLTTFAQGTSLCLAVRRAREQLHSLEATYPCASWLPVICQNPAAPTLLYPRHNPYRVAIVGVLGAIVLTGLSLLLQHRWQEWQLDRRMSRGEKVLVVITNADKGAGVTAFGRGDFATAVTRFDQALQRHRNDPETLIYLNNARIAKAANPRPALNLVVSVPIGSNTNVAQEILRGVAHAQATVNHQGGINGQPLQVMIANDDNSPEVAKAIAARLVKDPQVLAVIGHNSSDASVAAAPIYVQSGLVMVTPTSFSDRLSSMGSYVFRMVPSIRFLADKLATHYIKYHPKAKIAICSDTLAVDNESYRNQFANGVLAQTIGHPGAALIQVPCDFSAQNFDPDVAITTLINRGANTVLLAPHVDRISKATDLARANRGRLKLLASTSLHTAVTLELGKEAVNDLLLAVPWHSSLESGHSFSREAEQLWGGRVNWRTAMSYDATQAIAAGLRQSTSPLISPRDGLRDVLRSSDFEVAGATGTIRFIQSGERQIAPGFSVLVQVKPVPHSRFGYDFVPLPPELELAEPATLLESPKDL